MPHPMQEVHIAADKVARFRANRIVAAVYEHAAQHGLDLNKLAIMGFSDEDHNQFAQLLGWSVSGFGDLSYADPELVEKADALAAQLGNK